MDKLFTRDGAEFNGSPEFNDAGRPVRLAPIVCDRCHVINGQRLWVMGIENGRPYSRTGYDCWTCGNTGVRGQRKERLYTEVELARVNKAAATREANRAAAARAAAEKAAADRIERETAYRATYADFLAKIATLCTGSPSDFWDRLAADLLADFAAPTARQIELVNTEVAKRAANAKSEFFGAVGEKVTMAITVERIITLSSPFYGTNFITIGRTAEGNVVTYKGLADLGAVGETSVVKATIKEHTLYNNVCQTVIQRPKVMEQAL
jgi:hypothetical protein